MGINLYCQETARITLIEMNKIIFEMAFRETKL